MLFYEPQARDCARLPHDPFTALVAPRPIGWISTLGADGVANLAPYSFSNIVSSSPPILMFASQGVKDSAENAIARGEFVWNLVTDELRNAMSESSRTVAPDVSEFGLAGLEPAPSMLVAPPRVAAAAAAFECRVTQTLPLRDAAGRELDRRLVLGQVVGVHLDERCILPDGRIDTAALRPVARAGYRDEYAVVESILTMARPD